MSIFFWATRNTLELLPIAHSMAAMLFFAAHLKWTRLFGKTTSPRRAMAGRWCVCRLHLDRYFFRHCVNLPKPRPSLAAGTAFVLSGGRAQSPVPVYYSRLRRRLQWGPLFLPALRAPQNVSIRRTSKVYEECLSRILNPSFSSAGSRARRISAVSAPMASPSTSMTGA